MQSLEAKRKKVKKIITILSKLFPNAKTILHFSNPWELLVAVMLSAQCTDKIVNKVTISLFKKYKILDDYVNAVPSEFEEDIHSTGFFRNKTKNILATAKMIKYQYAGNVPVK